MLTVAVFSLSSNVRKQWRKGCFTQSGNSGRHHCTAGWHSMRNKEQINGKRQPIISWVLVFKITPTEHEYLPFLLLEDVTPSAWSCLEKPFCDYYWSHTGSDVFTFSKSQISVAWLYRVSDEALGSSLAAFVNNVVRWGWKALRFGMHTLPEAGAENGRTYWENNYIASVALSTEFEDSNLYFKWIISTLWYLAGALCFGCFVF